jgi:hypothetical protein
MWRPEQMPPARPPRNSRSTPARGAPAPAVDAIGPPVSRAPWSPDFSIQSLEVLPIFLESDALFWLKPVHADSLRVGMPKGAAPADLVLQVLAWYPLRTRLVHSTSWRQEGGRIVLTYLAAVDPPEELPRDSVVKMPVERAALARGDTMAAPRAIETVAVIEHALRHLNWLLGDDPAVAAALPDWRALLADYQPEPFRSL